MCIYFARRVLRPKHFLIVVNSRPNSGSGVHAFSREISIAAALSAGNQREALIKEDPAPQVSDSTEQRTFGWNA